jgi:colanic acid/amylovoran biosynthesis protein
MVSHQATETNIQDGEQTMITAPMFVLAGNGPYLNRGCEAILRGTTEILRHSFNETSFVALSIFHNTDQYRNQRDNEQDCSVEHEPLRLNLKAKSIPWYYCKFKRMMGVPFEDVYFRQNKERILSSDAVLCVGGDNYSLDYGIPELFTMLDYYVLALGKPLIYWGASVGPFSKNPTYEQYMAVHLKQVTAIFAREQATVEYLESIGVNHNVYLMADPAFVMKPAQPTDKKLGFALQDQAIGLNFSPLMAKFVTDGDKDAWQRTCRAIIEKIARAFDRPIYLIPHVTIVHSDDHAFMQAVLATIDADCHVTLVPPCLNAQETKWLIGRMAVFAGARTHATIAALSSAVPTLSFAYSIKAKGINRDVYGHTDYCIQPGDLTADLVIEKIRDLITNASTIKKELAARIPMVQQKAFAAGDHLKGLLR